MTLERVNVPPSFLSVVVLGCGIMIRFFVELSFVVGFGFDGVLCFKGYVF